MLFEHSDYRAYLKAVLVKGISKNSSFSLRALSAKIGIPPSHLSLVIRGKKNLSIETAAKVAKKLGLNSNETEFFITLVQFSSAKAVELKSVYFEKLKRTGLRSTIQNLSLDSFKLIADWYHIPIIEMADLEHPSMRPEKIATRLGIKVIEAQVALERLCRLKLLELTENGYRRNYDVGTFSTPDKNQALRSFHKQMLEKAVESLETQSNKEKFSASQTFAFDPSQISQAKEILRESLEQLVQLAKSGKKKSQIYHIEVQLFNLTKES